MPRMPTREALRGMTPEHVETSLSSFTMRRQGAALSPAERRAVAAFVTGRPAGLLSCAARRHPEDGLLQRGGLRQRRFA